MDCDLNVEVQDNMSTGDQLDIAIVDVLEV